MRITPGEKMRKTNNEKLVKQFDEQNAESIMNALTIASQPRVDFDDPQAVKDRICNYFVFCAEHKMKCSVAGIAASLGIDRRRLHEARTGQIPHGFRQKVPKDTIDMIDYAYSVYETYLEDMVLSGNVHPIAAIFLLKCNSGYQEEQKVIIQNDNALGDVADVNEIAERYKNIVE